MSNGSNEVQPFIFPGTGEQVRTVTIDGEGWIVAADVCSALGLTNITEALRRLDEDEFSSTEVVDSAGRRQQTYVVNEPGLYGLVLASRKPDAKAFKRWVKHDVLPAIRATGSYGTPAIPDMTTAEGRLLILDMATKAERRALAAETRVAELEPDAARAQRTLDAEGLALVGTVAKRFGIKEKNLRIFLYGEKLLINGGSRHNEPYARYIESGHFDLKTQLRDIHPDRPPMELSTTFVTPKGEALIWKRLFAAGMVSSPTMPALPPEQLELSA